MATIYIGSDHAGVGLRELLAEKLSGQGHAVKTFGPAPGESCDYPIPARAVCTNVLGDSGSFGILICGTGIGMSMAANRISGIRAALCSCEFQARACRQHNNANVLCLGERVTGPGVALAMAEMFLASEFEGGRHLRRVQMFDNSVN